MELSYLSFVFFKNSTVSCFWKFFICVYSIAIHFTSEVACSTCTLGFDDYVETNHPRINIYENHFNYSSIKEEMPGTGLSSPTLLSLD